MNLVNEGVLPPNELDDRDERREEREVAQERETVTDIVAEMFKFSDKRIEEGRDHAMTSESVGLVVHQLAKRFEAAWTREREELDKRISDLEAYAKLWTGRADELRLKCDEFYAKAKPVGNAAAIREALVKVLRLANVTADGENWDWNNAIAENVVKVVKEALAAPPRNCDIYTTSNDADLAITEHCAKMAETGECAKSCPYRESEGGCAFGWLLAPAAERKGEGK